MIDPATPVTVDQELTRADQRIAALENCLNIVTPEKKGRSVVFRVAQ